MNSNSLDKLEELASNRVEKSRVILLREISQLEHVERQINELRMINEEYQQGIVGASNVAPQQLAQRREFVEKLTFKLKELSYDKIQRKKRVDEKSTKFKLSNAQHSAIQIINERRSELRMKNENQREQQQHDEIASAQHLSRSRKEKENKYE